MNSHPNRPPVQQSSPSPMGGIAACVRTRWRAHRARRMEEDAMLCIRAMDTRLLNDIGLDIGEIGELSGELPHRASQIL